MEPSDYVTSFSQNHTHAVFFYCFVSSHSCSQGDHNLNTSSSALPPAKDDDLMDDALDYAIENGNWEQVAASAAALVEREM
jgi:hypothetical protein